jgi:hypothetical protein
MSAQRAKPRPEAWRSGGRYEANSQSGNALAAIGKADMLISAEKVERRRVEMGPGRAAKGTRSLYPLAE